MRATTHVLVRPPVIRLRTATIIALYEDDPWLQGPERLPLSEASLDVLFKYGPIVFGSRCFDAGEYNASVRNLMSRYPKISRQLAEQEIHEFLTDANGYLARTSDKKYKGPQEADIKPPVGLGDKLLVVAWVVILVPAAVVLYKLSMAASYEGTVPANQLANMVDTERLLDAAVDAASE